MRKTILICGIIGLLAGCSSASQTIPEVPAERLQQIVIRADDFKADPPSRTTLTVTSEGVAFAWGANDTVGIFPNTGAQAYFPMISGLGTKTASFTGGGWALKESATYAAYFPFIGNFYLDKAEIDLSYDGQKQTGNASLEHLGKYDYMAAPPVSPVDGTANFVFDHLGCLVQLVLEVPDAASFTSLVWECDQPVFTQTATLDLTGTSYACASTESSRRMEMLLENISTTQADEEITLYQMVYPVDLTGKTVNVKLQDEAGNSYQGTLTPKAMAAGYAYSFTATLEKVSLSSSVSAPAFGNENEM